MGRFVGDRIFSKGTIDGQVCTLLHASAMTKEIRLVCVVCVRVCISCTCRVPPYIQWVYMERGHYFCGLFFFPTFFLLFMYGTYLTLCTCTLCMASATYPFYNIRYLGKVGL